MSLADELLADLEENDQDELEESMQVDDQVEIKEEKPDVKDIMEQDTTQIASVRELCKLCDSKMLHSILKQIEVYQRKTRKLYDVIGPVETDPEYQVIVEANNVAADIDAEIGNLKLLFLVIFFCLHSERENNT